MQEAVDLSIEMRCQRAEYMMLPPLQPEYDADGELAQTVTFNSALMNECSHDGTTTNQDHEDHGAVVRIVLFPLVVKKGDDSGVGEDEIVVHPAQVLVARRSDKRRSRHTTPNAEYPAAASSLQAAKSQGNISTIDTELPEAEYLEGGF